MRPLGLRPQTPPGALSLDFGLFPSAESGGQGLESEESTLITGWYIKWGQVPADVIVRRFVRGKLNQAQV